MSMNINWGSDKYQEEKINRGKIRVAGVATFDRMVKKGLSEEKEFEQRSEWRKGSSCGHLT